MARCRSAKLPGVMWWELRGKCGGERRRRAVVREGEALACVFGGGTCAGVEGHT